MPVPTPRTARRPPRPACPWAAAVLLAGCQPDVGVVEIAWRVAGRDGAPFYPSGKLTPSAYDDTCDLPGTGPGGAETSYRLFFAFEICDPACGDCTDPACHVVPAANLPCDTIRYTAPEVPAADDPYLFSLRARIDVGDGPCEPAAPCVSVPGPIERKVRPGLVTDLQVVEVRLDAEGDAPPGSEASRLDLVACGCL